MKILILIILFSNLILYSQTPVLYPGFPKKLDSVRITSSPLGGIPLITDLERDGQKEIIVGTAGWTSQYRCMLYVIKSDGSHQTGFPKFIPQYRIRGYASGDINGDGYLEIVIRTDSLMYVFDRFGNNIPGFPVTSNLATSYSSNFFVHLYDLNNDGKLEIITGITNGITVFNWDGTTRAGWPIRFGNSKPSWNCAVGDLDNDGYGEIVTQTYKFVPPSAESSHVRILRHNGSNFGYNWPVVVDSGYICEFSGPSLYINRNNPSDNFIIVSFGKELNFPDYGHKIIKYNINGDIIGIKYCQVIGVPGPVSIGNDPINFVSGTQSDTDLRAFDSGLNVLSGFPVEGMESSTMRVAIIGRLTFGNELNILATGSLYYDSLYPSGLWGISSNGSFLPWSPLKATGYERTFIGFSFADINNDGSVEIIGTIDSIGSWWSAFTAHLYIWTLPGVPYSSSDHPWPMYGHDRYRTFQYGFTPPDEPIGIQPIGQNLPKEFKLHQNYPNPFNPFTNIRFDVPKTTYVSLVIYDVLGREVSRLVSEELKAGEYRISWDAGRYSSGIYFYRLIADGYSYTRKMIVAR